MGSAALLLAIIIASLICVRAGAIALELTGMDRTKARFQALSAFTNTGFTTRETEEAVHFPVRRKIITVLIIVGHAGTVSVIATFATSLLQQNFLRMGLFTGGVLLAIYFIYLLVSWQGLTTRISNSIRHWLTARYDLRVPSLENMLRVTEGFGVVRAVVQEGSALSGHTLLELRLKRRKVQILSITRGEMTIAIPQGEECLFPGDVLTCYGDMSAVAEMFSAGRESRNKLSQGHS
jgi:Trk K+ transport system NAD-binding subunit